MWEVLSEKHNLDASRSCIVGDRLDTDIAFATTNSLAASLAVLSGVTSEAEIKKYAELIDTEAGNHGIKAHLCPDYYATNLGHFEQLI